ncbi:hypothetical protein C0989_005270 [Termitomyces sp. Mn162]|nr:hypothetical protein C0989_005270 [Termitomyces sp. Mn162]
MVEWALFFQSGRDSCRRAPGLWKDVICERFNIRAGIFMRSVFLKNGSHGQVYQWSEDVVPTVAFNFRKIRKGNVTLKVWDVAGLSWTRWMYVFASSTESP